MTPLEIEINDEFLRHLRASAKIKDEVLDRLEKLLRLTLHTLDQRLQQRRLRVEVVVERPAGDLQISQDILEGHAFIAFGIDQALRRIEDIVALGSVFFFVDRARHS